MRPFLMTVLCFVIFQTVAAAQTDPRLDRVRELVGLMDQDATFRVAFEQIERPGRAPEGASAMEYMNTFPCTLECE